MVACIIKLTANLVLSVSLLSMLGCASVDKQIKAKATNAVYAILFESGVENAGYEVDDNGFVTIDFPRDTPEGIYNMILYKMRHDTDIKGVLAGKAWSCSIPDD